MTQEEEIDDKCDQARCFNAKKGTVERHKHFFLYEHWDVHPPDTFRKWWGRQPEAAQCKVVTAWNCQADRARYKRWSNGTPEPEEQLSPEETARGQRFLADLFKRKETLATGSRQPGSQWQNK